MAIHIYLKEVEVHITVLYCTREVSNTSSSKSWCAVERWHQLAQAWGRCAWALSTPPPFHTCFSICLSLVLCAISLWGNPPATSWEALARTPAVPPHECAGTSHNTAATLWSKHMSGRWAGLERGTIQHCMLHSTDWPLAIQLHHNS